MATTPAARQAAQNRAVLDLDVFAELLIAALEIPEVRRTVHRAVGAQGTRQVDRRTAVTAAQARDLKASRVAARGRGSRG